MAGHVPTDVTWEMKLPGTGWVSSYGGVSFSPAPRESYRIRIIRALADQQTTFSPTTANFTINNRNGYFSPRNALSPLFGKIGLNTQMRIGVKKNGTWDEYLRLPDIVATSTGNDAETADKASIRVTGDIDIRFEYLPAYSRVRRFSLGGRWNVSGNVRAWMIEQRSDGQFALLTSPDGTLAATLTQLSGATITQESKRIAVRVTLDVNDGAGNRVYKWYVSDSIDGTWTQVGSTQTVAGTTSIFAGSGTNLEVGSVNADSGPFSDSQPLIGKMYAFRVYSGISGTLVADFTPAGKGVGATTWADTCATPNTWILQGSSIRIASDRIRFTGEISSWPEAWDVTGVDRFSQLTSASLAKRYQSNKAPLGSPIYRLYRSYPLLRGYWPMEDSSGATQAFNAVSTGKAGALTSCTFGSADGLNGSAGALTLTSAPNVSKAVLSADPTLAATGYSTVLFYFKLASLPASDTTLLTLACTGTAARWTFAVSSIGFAFTARDGLGATLDTGSSLFGAGASPLNQWIGMQITLSQESGNIRWVTAWHAVGTNIFYSHHSGGSTFAGTLGKGFTQATFDTPDAAFAGAEIAHVIIAGSSDLDLVTNLFANVSKGYTGETAGRRMQRLCNEESVTFEWVGDIDDTALVGPQQPDTLNNLLIAAATVDAGLLGDGRDFAGYRYVSSIALGNRRGVTYNYSASELSATPITIGDDRYTVNDFTASRIGGSTGARYVADDNRPLSVNDPDDASNPGAGRYERTGSFNASDDTQMADIASQQVAIGTWDESRIPNLAVGLHRSALTGNLTLYNDTIACDFGDPAGLTGLAGSPLPPDDLVLLVFGYTEVIHNFEWLWTANTVPAGPYQVPILGTDDVNGEPRMDADFGHHVDTHTNGTISSGATSMIWRVDTSFAAKRVIDSSSYAAEFPVDFLIAGERVTLTAMTAPSSSADNVDGTFETGISGWDTSSCTFTQSTTFAHAGTHSGLLTVTGSPTGAFVRVNAASQVPVTVGKIYTVSGWVRSVVNLTDVHSLISWYDSSGSQVGTDQEALTALTSGVWASRGLSIAAPTGAVAARCGIIVAGSPATGTLLYIDDVSLSTAAYNYQTATLTRAVNGIVKTHGDGEEIHLADVFSLGRQ